MEDVGRLRVDQCCACLDLKFGVHIMGYFWMISAVFFVGAGFLEVFYHQDFMSGFDSLVLHLILYVHPVHKFFEMIKQKDAVAARFSLARAWLICAATYTVVVFCWHLLYAIVADAGTGVIVFGDSQIDAWVGFWLNIFCLLIGSIVRCYFYICIASYGIEGQLEEQMRQLQRENSSSSSYSRLPDNYGVRDTASYAPHERNYT